MWLYISLPGSRIAGTYGNCMFKELLDCLPKLLHHLTFPPAVSKGLSLLLQASEWGKVLFDQEFGLHFSGD